MPQIDFHIVDVFAREKYAGNQLAVFFDLEQQLSSHEMLQMTREINFAESTFITSKEADGSFGVPELGKKSSDFVELCPKSCHASGRHGIC